MDNIRKEPLTDSQIPFRKITLHQTNSSLERKIGQLESLLDRTDIIGYVAARNTQNIQNGIKPYLDIKDKLIREYGELVPETGAFSISPQSSKFSNFIEKLKDIARLEVDVEIYVLKYSSAIGSLSGKDLLALDWMFED